MSAHYSRYYYFSICIRSYSVVILILYDFFFVLVFDVVVFVFVHFINIFYTCVTPALNLGIRGFISASADLDKDGKLDIVANSSEDSIIILLGGDLGGFVTPEHFDIGSKPLSIISEDFDGDGNWDIAVANDDLRNLSMLYGDGMGRFSNLSTIVLKSPVHAPISLTSGDFDNDGDLDIATANLLPLDEVGLENISILLSDEEGFVLSG